MLLITEIGVASVPGDNFYGKGNTNNNTAVLSSLHSTQLGPAPRPLFSAPQPPRAQNAQGTAPPPAPRSTLRRSRLSFIEACPHSFTLAGCLPWAGDDGARYLRFAFCRAIDTLKEAALKLERLPTLSSP